MVDGLIDRMDEWLYPDKTEQGEIKDTLDGSGWSTGWDQSTLEEAARKLSDRRDAGPVGGPPSTTAEVLDRTTTTGPQDSRRTQVRKSDGTFGPSPDNIKSTWEDTHGNIMYEHTNGNRSKLIDSTDR